MAQHAIRTTELTRTFPGGVVALSALDLAVETGTVYGLIGRNGAGKTTAIRILAGVLRPDSGSAKVLGLDVMRASRADRARLAYVPQAQQLHAWMTVGELCTYLSHFY